MNKIHLTILISLLLIFSCKPAKKDAKFLHTQYLQEWINNYRIKGGKLYDSIDMFNMKGINEYKFDYIKRDQMLYGLEKIDSNYSITSIDAREFWFKAGAKPVIESKKYYKKDNYFINTDIFIEDVMISRTVTYVYSDYIILYDYAIINDYEFLSSVEFQYKNGIKKHYENTNGQTFIESNPYLIENDIYDFFKKMKN